MSVVRLVTAECSLTPPEAAQVGNCAWCGKELARTKSGAIHKTRTFCSPAHRALFSMNHRWNWARDKALARDKHACVRCGSTEHLEVNHIHALADQGIKGYAFGCHHHIDNLETLCREHHVEVTKQQRAARKARSDRPTS